MKDYYKILGIPSNATLIEIKNAYRKLARKYHPDLNNDKQSEDYFKDINEAYETLRDKTKRIQYDSKMSAFNATSIFTTSQGFNMNEIFKNFGFNKTQTNKRKKKFSSELNISISITMEEAILGMDKKIIKYLYKNECDICKGYGGELEICPKCQGQGNIQQIDNFVRIVVSCNECNGTGKILSKGCNKCSSNGYVENAEEIEIKIPEGIDDKTQLVVRKKGNIINGKRGDLFINLIIDKDSKFKRKNNDLILLLEVNALDILKQKIIEVEGIRKNFKIDLKDGFHGKKYIFPSEGIKSLAKGVYGNFIIELNVIFPKLSDEQIKKLNKIL